MHINFSYIYVMEDAECREGGSLYGETDAKYSGTDNPENK